LQFGGYLAGSLHSKQSKEFKLHVKQCTSRFVQVGGV